MSAESLHGFIRLELRKPQGFENLNRHFQAGAESFADVVMDAEVQEAKGMLPVAGPGKNGQVRKVLADQFPRAYRCFYIVDGDHEDLGVLCMSRAQQFQPRCVAIKDLIAEAAEEVDLCLAGFERRERYLFGLKNTADDLSEASEAGDDDLGVKLDGRVEGSIVRPGGFEQDIVERQQHRA